MCTYLIEHSIVTKMLFRDSDPNSEFPVLLFNASHVRSIYEKIFSEIQDENTRKLMITFLINGAYQVIRQWLLEDIPMTPKEMGELAVQLSSYKWERPL